MKATEKVTRIMRKMQRALVVVGAVVVALASTELLPATKK